MPPHPPTLQYQTPPARLSRPRLARSSVGRFLGGIASYAAMGYLLLRINSIWGMQRLARIGLAGLHEAVMWLIGLGFVALVIYLQKKYRWTAFTLGVLTGVTLTLLALALFLLYVAWGLRFVRG